LLISKNTPVVWKCFIGNAKRWKVGKLEYNIVASGKETTLFAEKIEQLSEGYLVSSSGIMII